MLKPALPICPKSRKSYVCARLKKEERRQTSLWIPGY